MGKREGLNYTVVQRTIEFPPGRYRVKAAAG